MLQIGQKAPSGLADPIGMMEDCHLRIRAFLGTLVRVGEMPEDRPLGLEEADALDKALVYFREAAPRHTLDEEESLFPRLRDDADPRAKSVARTLDDLEHDHEIADRAHAELDALGREWLERGTLAESKRAHWRRLVEHLASHYARHIEIEESHIFKVARQVLGTAEKREIAVEMARRRGRTVT